MGILRNTNEVPKAVRIEDAVEITYADYVFDDSSDDDVVIVSSAESEECHDIAPIIYARRNSSRKALRNVNRSICQIDVYSAKKNMGARKLRRMENARILASLIDPDDICYDCSDLVETNMSVFSRLLQDEEGMRLWHELIEEDETENERLLEKLETCLGLSGKQMSEYGKDSRQVHPAYSGKTAKTHFDRLDKKFRNALMKRHVPLNLLKELENELRTFFTDNPSGVWTKQIGSEYRRFYAHAVAQFLTLRSKSHALSHYDKLTEIENPNDAFRPPEETLYGYLAKIQT